MLVSDFLLISKWAAAIFLSMGYWIQVYKIHQHKEVRDLSVLSYILFAIAYVLLGIEGYQINSTLFIWKNVLVLVPTLVIVLQIFKHREDKWND